MFPVTAETKHITSEGRTGQGIIKLNNPANLKGRIIPYRRGDLLTYLLTPWSRVLLEKVTGFQLVKKSLYFMETEGSSPRLQKPATCL